MTIGENIRAFRKKRGLSQRELGERIGTGMSQQQLAQYENGIRIPKADTIQLIADALETPVQNLLPSGRYTPEQDLFDPAVEWIQGKLPGGYTIRTDETDCLLWIEYPDKGISKDISLSDMQTIVNNVMEFFKFELEKLRKD